MKKHSKKINTLAFLLFALHLNCQSAFANPVWHCSRSDVQVADASDDFTLASLNSVEREVIRLSLRDLYSVYLGATVKLTGSFTLSACVFDDNAHITKAAMTSIGAKAAAKKSLANSSSLAAPFVHVVSDEADMLLCIAKNHPAVGFLSKPIHTEAVGPCF